MPSPNISKPSPSPKKSSKKMKRVKKHKILQKQPQTQTIKKTSFANEKGGELTKILEINKIGTISTKKHRQEEEQLRKLFDQALKELNKRNPGVRESLPKGDIKRRTMIATARKTAHNMFFGINTSTKPDIKPVQTAPRNIKNVKIPDVVTVGGQTLHLTESDKRKINDMHQMYLHVWNMFTEEQKVFLIFRTLGRV